MSRRALSGSFNLSMRNRNRKFDLIVSSLCLPACLRLTSSLWKKTNTIEELKIVLENRTTICGLLSLRTHDNELQTYGGCFDVTRCCHGMKLVTVDKNWSVGVLVKVHRITFIIGTWSRNAFKYFSSEFSSWHIGIYQTPFQSSTDGFKWE